MAPYFAGDVGLTSMDAQHISYIVRVRRRQVDASEESRIVALGSMARYVYVIKLSDEVLSSAKFRKANPQYEEGKDCVYVGSSWHPPEKRFEQHLSGERSNTFAEDYGERLMWRRCREWPEATQEEIEAAEEREARKLRARGWAVWQR